MLQTILPRHTTSAVTLWTCTTNRHSARPQNHLAMSSRKPCCTVEALQSPTTFAPVNAAGQAFSAESTCCCMHCICLHCVFGNLMQYNEVFQEGLCVCDVLQHAVYSACKAPVFALQHRIHGDHHTFALLVCWCLAYGQKWLDSACNDWHRGHALST